MHLVRPTAAHVDALMQWFPDAASVALWSPANHFPFVHDRFAREAKLEEVPSFMLVDATRAPLAFGQYYLRLGCCHLSRLVVAPAARGRGIGAVLIDQLCRRGCIELDTLRCSLFVLASNDRALRLYLRMGFVETPYPDRLPLPDCLYMTRDFCP